MQRPILIATIGYIIGILWGLYFKISIAFVMPILIILIVISYKYNKYSKVILNKKIIIIICVFSIISNTTVHILNNRYNNLYNNIENVKATGVIISDKKTKEYTNEYTIKIKNINKSKKFNNTKLILKTKDENLKYGDLVEINGVFNYPAGQRNYKGFDYKEHLKTRQIYGTIKSYNIKVIEKNSTDIINMLANNCKNKIIENLKSTLDEKQANILIGILLGQTEDIEDEVLENFRISSLSHVLAVSGLHIGYIITAMLFFIKLVRLNNKITKLVIIAMLLFFMILVGNTPSVVRACLMGIITIGGSIFYRKSDTLNNISLSCLIILISNPFNINNLGFLLSFGGTIGIVLFNSAIIKCIHMPKKLEFLKSILSVTISAQIVIFPIIAIYFNKIYVLFFLTNILTSQLIGVIIVLGCIHTILSFVSFNLLSYIMNFLIFILDKTTNIFANIPIAQMLVIRPNILIVVMYYIIMFFANYLIILKNRRHIRITERKFVEYVKQKLKIIIPIIIIIILFVNIFNKLSKNLCIYFVDVGQGDCSLVITPNNKKILIDGGGGSSLNFDIGEKVLIPYLLARGIQHLDYIMISHFDTDHCQGLISVLKNLKVNEILIAKQVNESEEYIQIIKLCKEKNIKIRIVVKGDKIILDKQVYLDIIYVKENINLNNNSIVAKLQYKSISMLFTGDIEETVELDMIKEYKDSNILNSTILKVAHHGSKTSSNQCFLELVQPKICLIGVGKNNTFGHPNKLILKRLMKYTNRIYRTDQNGEVSIEINKKGNMKINKMIN